MQETRSSLPTSPREIWIAILYVTLSIGGIGLGLKGITSSVDTRVYFSDNNPHLQRLLAFESKYSQTNSLVIFVRVPGDYGVSRLLSVIRSIHERALHLDRVLRVDSLVNYPYIVHNESQIEIVNFGDFACTATDCGNFPLIFKRADAVNRIISPDGRVAAITMTFDVPFATPNAISETTNDARALINDVKSVHHQAEFAMVGSISQMDAFREASRSETYKLIIAAITTVTLLLTWLYRNFLTPIYVLLLGLIGGLSGVAFLGLTQTPLNTTTTAVPVIGMLLIVATSLHVMNSFHQQRPQHFDRAEVMRFALKLNARPILLTTMTTIAGLLSLNFADAPPLGQLANAVSISLIVGILGLFALSPLVACYLPKRLPRNVTPSAITLQQRYPHLTGVLVGSLAVSCSLGVSKISVDEDFVGYFSDAYEFRRGADFAQKYMAGPKAISIDLDSNRPNGIETIQYQELLQKLTTWLRQQTLIANVTSISDAMEQLEAALDEPNSEHSSEKIAQLLLAYEMSLSEGQDLREHISVDRSSSRVTAILNRCSSNDIIRLDDLIRRWFTYNAPHVYSISVTGINVPVAYMAVENISAVIGPVAYTILGMCVALGLYFRSLAISVASLISIGAPILMGFGIWGWAYGEIGMAASVVFAIAVGLVIDDAIHLIYRFTSATHAGYSLKEAQTIAMEAAGSPITQTSIALSAGFLVLTFSGFQVNRVLGLCTVGIFACAWIFDFFVLPRLLTGLLKTHTKVEP